VLLFGVLHIQLLYCWRARPPKLPASVQLPPRTAKVAERRRKTSFVRQNTSFTQQNMGESQSKRGETTTKTTKWKETQQKDSQCIGERRRNAFEKSKVNAQTTHAVGLLRPTPNKIYTPWWGKWPCRFRFLKWPWGIWCQWLTAFLVDFSVVLSDFRLSFGVFRRLSPTFPHLLKLVFVCFFCKVLVFIFVC